MQQISIVYIGHLILLDISDVLHPTMGCTTNVPNLQLYNISDYMHNRMLQKGVQCAVLVCAVTSPLSIIVILYTAYKRMQ